MRKNRPPGNTNISMQNPRLIQVVNRWTQLLKYEDVYVFYTGAFLDTVDRRRYEFSGTVQILDISLPNNEIDVCVEFVLVSWWVSPIEPYTFELLAAGQKPKQSVYDIQEHEIPEHVRQLIDERNLPPVRNDEYNTRIKLIDPTLQKCGWFGDFIKEELSFISEIDGRRRRPDYWLYAGDGIRSPTKLLGFLEAKHEGLSPDYGLEQAKLYAVLARKNVRFVFSTNGHKFVQFDRLTGNTTPPASLEQFPKPDELDNLLRRGETYVDPPLTHIKLPVSRSEIDSSKDEDARAVIEAIIPADERQQCLQFLADSIKFAHRLGVGKWEITLAQNGNFIRLNVGKIEVCAFFYYSTHIILDEDKIAEADRERIERFALLGISPLYQSVPSSISCDFLNSCFVELQPLIWEAYTSLIAESALTVKERTGYFVSHSSGIMKYLRQTIDPTLPDPVYE